MQVWNVFDPKIITNIVGTPGMKRDMSIDELVRKTAISHER